MTDLYTPDESPASAAADAAMTRAHELIAEIDALQLQLLPKLVELAAVQTTVRDIPSRERFRVFQDQSAPYLFDTDQFLGRVVLEQLGATSNKGPIWSSGAITPAGQKLLP